jgi:hypothetical protein
VTQPPVPGRGTGDEPGRGAGLPGGRDPRLAAFAEDNAGDRCPPGPWTGMVLNELSGPDRRCADATDDELIGLLGRWAAQESWAVAAKLGVIRELLRRRALPGAQVRRLPCGLPDAWDETVAHEVTAVLGISLPAADKLTWLAWALEARLPRIGAALEAGVIDYVKARAIAEETSVLDDAHVAAAEEMIVAAGLAGKTPGQVGKLAARAVVTVDPDGARRRREQAEKEDARVRFWRERAGTSAIAGYGLPTDAALQANANIGHRAEEYKKAGLDGTMDQLRVLAYLDILNGITAAGRITQAEAEAARARTEAAQAGTGTPDAGSAADASGATGDDEPGDDLEDKSPRDDGPEDDGASGSSPDDRPAPGGGPIGGQPASGPAAGPGLAARTNLTIPLPTLLGLADRPGDGHGLGPLDPDLARQLTVNLEPVPLTDCDHRHESHAYQPNNTLRHLAQIRDGECTFPTCSRHARESDFEHATPYDKGGRTCACNAGARSRRCHRTKQSNGWNVTQPLPGWHQWKHHPGAATPKDPCNTPHEQKTATVRFHISL